MVNLKKGSEGNRAIKNAILSGVPFSAAKLGFTEQSILLAYFKNNFNDVRRQATDNAGITPSDDFTLEFFCKNYIQSIQNCDLIGSFGTSNENQLISKLTSNTSIFEARFLEPYYHDDPWTNSLKDMNVLVIHPFEETITKQYRIRENIFSTQNSLPKFNLLTIRSEQTNGGGRIDSKPFIDSLEIMKNKIDYIDFDIALIGCGAYSLLLSDFIKNKNKQTIYMGGSLQILFGIKGKRWDNHQEISAMYNDHWCRPSENEKTLNIELVEGGTYW
jgi:hypothetical protein